jgi:hypothetical protein
MIQLLETILTNVDRQILRKYEATLVEISKLNYVYGSDSKKTYLSGKLEAYEEISFIIKMVLSSDGKLLNKS